MTEVSYMWDCNTGGDSSEAPYDQFKWAKQFEAWFLNDATKQGIITSQDAAYSGNLAVTNTGALTMSVATGMAMVKGWTYFNTAAVTLALGASPAVGTDYYIIVLRRSLSGIPVSTVRLAIVGPVNGSAPAVTQNVNGTWEIKIATVTKDSAGVIVVTDERPYLLRPEKAYSAFTPCMNGYNITGAAIVTDATTRYGGVTMLDTNDTEAYGYFIVPDDILFNTIPKVYAQCIAYNGGSGNLVLDMELDWGQGNNNETIAYRKATNSGVISWTAAVNELAALLYVNMIDSLLNHEPRYPRPGDVILITFKRTANGGADNFNNSITCLGFYMEYIKI